MHIPDNYLSPQTDAVMAVAMVPVWVHCIKKVRATLDREHMAFPVSYTHLDVYKRQSSYMAWPASWMML